MARGESATNRPRRGSLLQGGRRRAWPLDMPRVDPLKRLREIRDQFRLVEALVPERDELIRRALRQGSSERKVGDAAGLSQPRINQIAGDLLDR